MGKTLLIAVGGGGLSAVASLAALLGLPGAIVFACFAPLPLLLIGLSLGPAAAAAAGGAGTAAAALIAGVAAAGIFGALHAVPAWLVARQALLQGKARADGASATWPPVGAVLASLAMLTAILACAVAVGGSGSAGIEASVRGVLDTTLSTAIPGLPAEGRDAFIRSTAPFFVGIFGVTWQLLFAGNGVLAQAIAGRQGWNIRPTPAWSELTLPDWLSWPLVGTAVVALLGSGDVQYLARNAVLILAAPYFFLGLAVVHAMARQSQTKGLFLVAFYVMLIVFLLVAGALVTGLGMIEQWAGIRRRFAANRPKE